MASQRRHACGKPSQPLGALEKLAYQLVGPQADGQRDEDAERAGKYPAEP